jgi:hypothetical protein
MTDKKIEPPKPAAAPRATPSPCVPDKTVEGPKNVVVRENERHPKDIVKGPDKK